MNSTINSAGEPSQPTVSLRDPNQGPSQQPLPPSFLTLLQRLSPNGLHSEIITSAQKLYDIKCFKFSNGFNPQSAAQIYKQLQSKRQLVQGQLSKSKPYNWQENERRLFVWYALCFCHLEGITFSQLKQEHFRQFSQLFFNKEPIFLEYQCQNLIKRNSRCTWSSVQDQILAELVQEHSSGKWNQIAKEMFFKTDKKIFRTPKQCRERWFNHLDQSKVKGIWENSEDLKIMKFVKQHGKKWAKIVPILNLSRTEHMIKNRFKSLLVKNGSKSQQDQIEIINNIIGSLENIQKIQEATDSILFGVTSKNPMIKGTSNTSIHSNITSTFPSTPEFFKLFPFQDTHHSSTTHQSNSNFFQQRQSNFKATSEGFQRSALFGSEGLKIQIPEAILKNEQGSYDQKFAKDCKREVHLINPNV